MLLLVFEFFGTTEMLVIALVALIIFGPRKLPELGRSLGKSIGEFKRASEDFKRTWEREVEVERIERDLRFDQEVTPAASSPPAFAPALAGGGAAEQSIARTPSGAAASQTKTDAAPDAAADAPAQGEAVDPASKQDWL
jgi:TatA/E family protein of Tat protein translocase